ncbi:hypothetical protein RRG08_046461 [Elysia crispata]|uniref:Uncharacterized protein n=1 Tax=Elysia crispata TaxID=231223 RepID=A0AAE0YJK9_9GAST|nr:hypothetical protein RRG08_046461 [Elysia crispata]
MKIFKAERFLKTIRLEIGVTHERFYCQECPISHPSKVMLKMVLNRPKPQEEKIIAEEQASFREERSTKEHIFNPRILGERYLQHQQSMYHDFVDFYKSLCRVWDAPYVHTTSIPT